VSLNTPVAIPASAGWTSCSFQGHLDEVRIHHEDLAGRPSDRDRWESLWSAVGELLNHIDGFHADDCRIHLTAKASA